MLLGRHANGLINFEIRNFGIVLSLGYAHFRNSDTFFLPNFRICMHDLIDGASLQPRVILIIKGEKYD